MHVEAMWGKDPARVHLLYQHRNQSVTKLNAQNISNILLMFTLTLKGWHVS